LWIAQYLPTSELEIFIGEYSLTPESGILYDDHKNGTQTNLSQFKIKPAMQLASGRTLKG